MNILLTGACGYIGSHVADLLSTNKGNKLFVVDNLSTGFRCAIPDSALFLNADLADSKAVENFVSENKIDAIMHFAGKISVPESIGHPDWYYECNTVNTYKLLVTAKNCGVKYFIFSSTAAVYSEINDKVKIAENFPKSPKSPYGASKLMSERIISDICSASNIKYGILRYFNVSGADPQLRLGQRNKSAQHLIKMCCKVLTGELDELKIYGNDYNTSDGTGVRDYIHVSDLAQAHVDVLDYLTDGNNISNIFNVGYGRGFSVLEVISAMEDVSGKKIPYKFVPRRTGDCAEVVSSNDKILALTRWRPRYNDIKKIANDSYQWELKMLAERK